MVKVKYILINFSFPFSNINLYVIFCLLLFTMKESHKRFADKYFETLNASLSAEYAGFSAETAKQEGWRLLQRDDIDQYLTGLKAEYAEKTGLNKEWVMKRFEHISDACIKAKPVMKWNAQLKEFEPIEDEHGNPVYEFDSSGANKATEMIGKIIGVFEKDNDQKAPAVIFNFDSQDEQIGSDVQKD